MLCDVFATVTGATTLGLRVDVTDRACDPRIHRSPQPRAGQTRVLLTLDAL